ncbi:MAG: hypothetical protein M3R14_11050, partial [Acidobacteriota bacterium]|nr:hypothetical protein [Acidobacteriota bacterium]
MMSHTARAKFLLFVILFLGTAAEIFAADGDLDPSFDGDGIVITDNGSTFESIADIAVQPDGKIIAVGYGSPGIIVVRYNPDGSLDSTFGTGGKAIIPSAFPSSLALQPDGKIVLGGSKVVGTTGESPISDFFVDRLNSNGSLDTTFNGTGTLVLDLRGGNNDISYSVKIQPDGKIVLGGTSERGIFGPNDYAIVRFNPDGSLDTTFDGDGKVFTIVANGGPQGFFGKIALKPDGKILATGSAYFFPGGSVNGWAMATVCYNPDGSLNTAFDGDGMVFTQQPSEDSFANSIIAQPDWKILVVGRSRSFNGQDRIFLVRYNANGSLDSSFGVGGKALLPAGGSATDVEVQADNKILIAITYQLSQGTYGYVARLRADGSPDTIFGGGGFNGLPFGLPTRHRANSVALQPNGKVLIGGSLSVGTNDPQDFMLARFENSVCTVNCSAPSRERIADFDGDGKTDLSVFRNGTWFINPSSANNPN